MNEGVEHPSPTRKVEPRTPANLTPRERCEKRLGGLKATRQPYEAEWREIASLAQPARSRFLNVTARGARSERAANRKLVDDYGIYAFNVTKNGMASGLSSPSRPWLKAETLDPDLMQDNEVAEWLAHLEDELYALFRRSGFYPVAATGYGEMSLFGIEGAVMVEDWEIGGICHSLTAGEFWTALDHRNRPNVMYRRVPMTAAQVVERFAVAPGSRDVDWSKVSPNIKSAWDRSDYEMAVNVMHAIEPNREWDARRLDEKGKPWASVWWDEADQGINRTLRVGGYEEQPFWAPRWETVGGDIYSSIAPGINCLPSLRTLQLQAKRKGEATDLSIHPELIVPASLRGQVKRMPRNVVYAAVSDMAEIKTSYQVDYRTIGVVREDLQDVRESINRLAFVDLFMAITNMRGVQPRNIEELASRNEEALTQLGPTIERVETEKLQIAIDRGVGILARSGRLREAPEALQGQALKFEFISILAQMQRLVGIGQMERSVGFVGNLAGVKPGALDLLDEDATVREYFHRAGAPAVMLRSDREVAGIRQQRAQAEAQQKAMEAMPAMQQGADAARLLSETDNGDGTNLMQQLLGGGLGA